jgi:uncharacterized protein
MINVKTVVLLCFSNMFMTFAWYGLLKVDNIPMWKAILLGWAVALFEYAFMVPANRIGYLSGMNGFQLKVTQEVITLIIFSFFAVYYLKEPFHWKYLVSFLFILGAVYFAFKK